MNQRHLDSEQFEQLCGLVFDRALNDVNASRRSLDQLTDPKDVSGDSFKRYLVEHHPRIQIQPSVEMLSMAIYRKAIDDISFQANIYQTLLRDIPIRHQVDSCEFALSHVNEDALLVSEAS